MKSNVQKIAVFGGSFDPVTFAHVDIVCNLEKKFDRVIVVPSFISPFKSGADDAEIRLALCKKLFASQKTEVCRYEIAKKGVSYSALTAEYLCKRNAGAKLFFVIGSEELVRLEEWHDIDKLKTLVTFYAISRPGYVPSEKLLKTLKARRIKIKTASFTGTDISSTVVKLDAAFGKPNMFVPDAVHAYIRKGYFDPYGKYVKKLREYGLDYRRLEHTYRTAVRGAYLAKKYGESVSDAVVACLLHDIAKSVDVAEYAHSVDISGYPAPTAHAPIGAYIARKEFDVSDRIYNAIRLHSTADANMTLLDEIVYLADKTESGRSYRSLELMLKLCELDKDVAMLEALSEIGELEKTDKCDMSERALAYYREKCGNVNVNALVGSSQLPAVGAASKAVKPTEQKPSKAVKVTEERPSKAVAVARQKQTAVAAVKIKHDAANKDISEVGGIKAVALATADELDKHKARDIDIIALDGKTIIADYFVIATCSSSTAVKALNGYVEDRLKKQFDLDPIKRDVDREWVALDYGGVIVHIFTDKMREFYNIERLWSDGSNVERYGE